MPTPLEGLQLQLNCVLRVSHSLILSSTEPLKFFQCFDLGGVNHIIGSVHIYITLNALMRIAHNTTCNIRKPSTLQAPFPLARAKHVHDI